jgi:hypothetical protein
MTALTHFLHFWYDFLAGDDWMMAAGVVPALAVSAGLACRDWHAWWVLPVAAVVLLTAPPGHLRGRRTGAGIGP